MSTFDFSQWELRNAALSFLNYNKLKQINTYNAAAQSGYSLSFTPFQLNKVGLYNSRYASSTVNKKGSFTANSNNEQFNIKNLVGGIAPYNDIAAPNFDLMPVKSRDPVIYFTWQSLSTYITVENYRFYTPKLLNNLCNSKAPNKGGTANLFYNSRLGALLEGKFVGSDDTSEDDPLPYWRCTQAETDLGNVDDWIIIREFAFLDYQTETAEKRDYFQGDILINNYVTAAIPFTLSNIGACYSGNSTSIGTTNPINGIIGLNPALRDTISFSINGTNLMRFICCCDVYTILANYELGVSGVPPVIKTLNITKSEPSDDWKVIIAADKADTRIDTSVTGKNRGNILNALFHTQKYNALSSDIAYLDISQYTFSSSISQNYLMIFRGVESAVKFFKEWGYSATDSLETAQNMPTDFFPSTDFVPDGGTPSGYETNGVPNVPSIPDNTSDVIERIAPQISTLSACNAYALNVQECKQFFNFLITDTFIKNISELFNDKLSAINCLKMFPFDVALHDPVHTDILSTLSVANITADISNAYISDGYNTWIFGGTITQLGYYGDFNDFDNASYSLYIPFAGIVDLPSDQVVNCQLDLWYAVDLLTGNATAVIYSNNVLIKTVAAQMGMEIPITYSNANQQLINSSLAALNITSGLVGSISSGVGNIAVGNVGGGVGNIAGGIASGVTSAISSIVNNPRKVGTIGGMSSNTAYSLSQQPFLIISRDKIAIPSDYTSTIGRTAVYSGTISQFEGSGFITAKNVVLATIATAVERSEILGLLESGIFV